MASGTSNDDANANFGLSPVGTGSLTCSTPQPGDLSVSVTDAKDGTAISGADVKVQGPEDWHGMTDGSGVAIFQGIAAGPYTVTGTKSGYTIDTTSANVPEASCASAKLKLRKIVLEIVDVSTGNVVSGTNQTKIVGQKIRLRVRTKPLGQTMTDTRWAIPGDRVKNYTQSVGSGVKTDLAAADLRNTSIDYYWISGGNQIVQVSAHVAGTKLSASVTYRVLRPVVDYFTTAISSVNICVGNYIDPGTWLAAFQPPATPGNQWDAQVTAPAGGDGQIGFTQLINVNRTRTSNAGGTTTLSTGGDFDLDGDLGIQYSGPQPIAAGGSAQLNGGRYSDSPANPLTGDSSASTASDSFQLYLMYQSSEPESIWVTLSKVNWNWAGKTTRTGAPAANTWGPATGTQLASDRNGTDSIDLPEWKESWSSLLGVKLEDFGMQIA